MGVFRLFEVEVDVTFLGLRHFGKDNKYLAADLYSAGAFSAVVFEDEVAAGLSGLKQGQVVRLRLRVGVRNGRLSNQILGLGGKAA